MLNNNFIQDFINLIKNMSGFGFGSGFGQKQMKQDEDSFKIKFECLPRSQMGRSLQTTSFEFCSNINKIFLHIILKF